MNEGNDSKKGEEVSKLTQSEVRKTLRRTKSWKAVGAVRCLGEEKCASADPQEDEIQMNKCKEGVKEKSLRERDVMIFRCHCGL